MVCDVDGHSLSQSKRKSVRIYGSNECSQLETCSPVTTNAVMTDVKIKTEVITYEK